MAGFKASRYRTSGRRALAICGSRRCTDGEKLRQDVVMPHDKGKGRVNLQLSGAHLARAGGTALPPDLAGRY